MCFVSITKRTGLLGNEPGVCGEGKQSAGITDQSRQHAAAVCGKPVAIRETNPNHRPLYAARLPYR